MGRGESLCWLNTFLSLIRGRMGCSLLFNWQLVLRFLAGSLLLDTALLTAVNDILSLP